MVLNNYYDCPIWHEKVNRGGYHSIGKYHKSQLYLLRLESAGLEEAICNCMWSGQFFFFSESTEQQGV